MAAEFQNAMISPSSGIISRDGGMAAFSAL
jgi:hypothetical protein